MSQSLLVVHHRFSKCDISQSSLSSSLPSAVHAFFPTSTLKYDIKSNQCEVNENEGNRNNSSTSQRKKHRSLSTSSSTTNSSTASSRKSRRSGASDTTSPTFTSPKRTNRFGGSNGQSSFSNLTTSSISKELNENAINLFHSSDSLLRELQSISHRNLVKYFSILQSDDEQSFYLLSHEYLHNLQQEINFCLKHNQFPNKQRVEQLFNCILSGMQYLNTWKPIEGLLGDGFYGIWHGTNCRDNFADDSDIPSMPPPILDPNYSSNQITGNENIRSKVENPTSFSKKVKLSISTKLAPSNHSLCHCTQSFRRPVGQGIVHPALTPHSITMSHKNILISDYIDENFVQNALGINNYIACDCSMKSSPSVNASNNAQPKGSKTRRKSKDSSHYTTELQYKRSNLDESQAEYNGLNKQPFSNMRYRLIQQPTFQNRLDALVRTDRLFDSNVIYVAPEYFVSYLENVNMEIEMSADTWSVAIIMLHYTLSSLFIETFFDSEPLKPNSSTQNGESEVLSKQNDVVQQNVQNQTNSQNQDENQEKMPSIESNENVNWESKLKKGENNETRYTLEDKFIDPLVFYSNINHFREVYQAKDLLSQVTQRRRENFEQCFSRLESCLTKRDLMFLFEGLRMTDRKSIPDLLSQINATPNSSTDFSPKSSKQIFELSSRYSSYHPPSTLSAELDPNPPLQATFDPMEEKLIQQSIASYMAWVKHHSMEKVIAFLNTRNVFTSSPLINLYPSIHSAYINPNLLAHESKLSKTRNLVQLHKHKYRIPTSFIQKWYTTQNEKQIHDNNGSTKSTKTEAKDMNDNELYMLRVKQYSSLADVNGDLLKYKSRHTYSFSQMLTENEQKSRYQYQRIELFRSLMNDYPDSRERIISEARKDIPAVLRGEIWSCILGVEKNYEEIFENILYYSSTYQFDQGERSLDFLSHKPKINLKTDCDRQIAVDVPRCHQYHSKLNCEEGRKKLEIVLKAWVKYHKGQLVYWQGLDSLCAPFVVLNYHDTALAFGCLRKLVDKYVRLFFLENNSIAMEYQLCMFEKLLSYHEPQVAHHMDVIGFKPELYTIPWFLTMFSHVLPIEKIFKLWDHILLDTHLLPLHIAVSFLKQQRTELLNSDFNEMMSVLTNMHHIRIEKVLEDSFALQQKTPECILEPKCLQYMDVQAYKELKYPRIVPDDLCFSDLYQVAIILDIQHQHNHDKRCCNKAYHIIPVSHRKRSRKSSKQTDSIGVNKMSMDTDANDQTNQDDIPADEWLENYEVLERDLMLLKSNIVHHLEYKRGIPIVLIADHPLIEQEIEKHLLRHNFPFVSIVHDGMKLFGAKHQQYVFSKLNNPKK